MKVPATRHSQRTLPQSRRTFIRFLHSTFALALLALIPPAASSAAAAVSYSQGVITNESDVLNIGTVILAVNLGTGAPAVTVNGVAFKPDSDDGLNGFVNGRAEADFSNQFPDGSPLDLLLSQLDFQDHGQRYSSLTLSGLKPGTPYLLQIFLSNIVNPIGKASRITIQGQTYDIANFGADADYVRAWFTASNRTEMVQFGKGSAGIFDRMVINAFVLSTTSAPNFTMLAVGISALALVVFFLVLGARVVDRVRAQAKE